MGCGEVAGRGVEGEEGEEEETPGETLSVVPSAILYLNGDFDGGTFYFTELDAKTVTVSVPLSPSLGDRNPQSTKGRVARDPLLKPGCRGALRCVTHSSDWPPLQLWSLGSQAEEPPLTLDPDDPVSLLKTGYSLHPSTIPSLPPPTLCVSLRQKCSPNVGEPWDSLQARKTRTE